MSKLNEIKTRIESVKGTKKITQAMSMVSASKFKKYLSILNNARVYNNKLLEFRGKIISNNEYLQNIVFFKENNAKKNLLVVISGDKGLCGSFNTNILKKTLEFAKELSDFEVLIIGSKASQYLKKEKLNIIDQHLSFFDNFSYEKTEQIANFILAGYQNGNWQNVFFIYNNFKTAISGDTIVNKFLPIKKDIDNYSKDIIYDFEPNFSNFVNIFVNKFLRFSIYKILLESLTAEQGARMTAMDSAVSNSNDMINQLSIKFNKARQNIITTEIAEIVSGAEALA